LRAPLFEHFAKGRNYEGMRDGMYAERTKAMSAASLPLQEGPQRPKPDDLVGL
jgi:hypothetical protein